MKKLGDYFKSWNLSPATLQEATWFHLCYFFGRRGREGWASMTKNTFVIKVDTEGHEYVTMNKTETTKNHQGGHKQKDLDYSDQRMYGVGVEVFRFHLEKLNPAIDRLFQNPLKNYSNEVWFKNEPMGKNALACIMQTISKKAGLSTVYTCHSVRASTIMNLYQGGIGGIGIMAVTKHKNPSSLQHYITDLSAAQKKDISGILGSTLGLEVIFHCIYIVQNFNVFHNNTKAILVLF